MEDLFQGKSIKDDFEAQVTASLMIQSNALIPIKEVRPLIHPVMGQRYRKAVNDLRLSIKDGQGAEAKQHVRALIEKIVLTPKEDRKELSIDLHGDLARILKIASEDKSMKNLRLETRKLEKKAINGNFLFEPSIQLVAGTGFEPVTFGL